MCIDICHESLMWYLVKCFLEVKVDQIHRLVVVLVIGVNYLCKEITQACEAAAFVSKSMLKVTY